MSSSSVLTQTPRHSPAFRASALWHSASARRVGSGPEQTVDGALEPSPGRMRSAASHAEEQVSQGENWSDRHAHGQTHDFHRIGRVVAPRRPVEGHVPRCECGDAPQATLEVAFPTFREGGSEQMTGGHHAPAMARTVPRRRAHRANFFRCPPTFLDLVYTSLWRAPYREVWRPVVPHQESTP